MNIKTIKEISSFYNNEIRTIGKKYSEIGEGATRDLMGKLYQTLCKKIVLSVDSTLDVKSNDYLTLQSKSKKYKLNNIQVDWHVYREDKLLMIVECKTYLDACYLKRAIDDFETIRKIKRNVPSIIFSGQNAVGKNAWGFYNDEYKFDSFFVNTEKRRSKLPLYKTFDPLDEKEIRRFAEYVRNIIQ